MSFWGQLFGSKEVIGKTVDAVINTGDALVFTEEEKSQANMEKLKWILEFHKASSGSNIARRLIAIMYSFAFLTLIGVVAALYGLGMDVAGDKIFALLTDTLVVPMGMIITFYFLAGTAHDIVSNRKK